MHTDEQRSSVEIVVDDLILLDRPVPAATAEDEQDGGEPYPCVRYVHAILAVPRTDGAHTVEAKGGAPVNGVPGGEAGLAALLLSVIL